MRRKKKIQLQIPQIYAQGAIDKVTITIEGEFYGTRSSTLTKIDQLASSIAMTISGSYQVPISRIKFK